MVSTVTQIEVLGWHRISTQNKENLERFMSNAQVIYIDSAIEAKAIELKQLQKIATPDAIIAATAICYQLTLVTRNVKDFEQIQGLSLYNPFG